MNPKALPDALLQLHHLCADLEGYSFYMATLDDQTAYENVKLAQKLLCECRAEWVSVIENALNKIVTPNRVNILSAKCEKAFIILESIERQHSNAHLKEINITLQSILLIAKSTLLMVNSADKKLLTEVSNFIKASRVW